ncbi:MAG: hypothetical protein QME64_00090 [bacterium]|nr:hypothetical protein [bacterium]
MFLSEIRYGYLSADWPQYYWNSSLTADNRDRAGKWRLDGFGPTENRAGGWPNCATYDPTNGTISNGQIYRSQKDPLGIQF